jgi:seryl-tRNA synthetase
MLDIKRIREETEAVRRGVSEHGGNSGLVDEVLAADGNRRDILQEVEGLKADRNRESKRIGQLKKEGEDTAEAQTAMRELGERIAQLDDTRREIEEGIERLLLRIPNISHPSAPVGSDETANRVVRQEGEPQSFDFEPKSHIEIGERLGLFDFPRAVRISGAGFPLFKGAGSRLERALIQFMLDLHVQEHGYTEVTPPLLVSAATMTGTGQLPKMEEDMYRMPEDDLYLIPTAEVPLVNFYREEIIQDPLPVYLTGHTPCFRREAGAAGKDTRGLLRVHQFDKVEMVKFTSPETSYDELESLRENAEDVLKRLGLVYRVLELCSGDMSFAATKCYDLELWAPGQNDWLEVSSCSNCEDFQARRAGIRYKDEHGKTRFVHTLNGSGVALPRLVVALLENGQKADGSVELPDAIVPYMGGTKVLQP